MLIHFHSVRHWKGREEYHKVRDSQYVQKLLGHRSLQSTQLYSDIDYAMFKGSNEAYHSKVARNTEEAVKLVELGFQYVTGEYADGGKIFRKRK
jgi:integrase